MSNQIQDSQLVPSVPFEPLLQDATLSALLACPDFRDGFEGARQAFEEDVVNEETPQTEDELIVFVNNELSTQMHRRGKLFEQLFGGSKLSYVHHIGFVVGYLNRLMATGTLS